MSKNGSFLWGWAEMENLLQCPVCLDIPATGPGITVEQCIHGHHICASCRGKLENCPLCKCCFHGTRNFVVEELVRNFDVLKNTMMLNQIVNDDSLEKSQLTTTAAASNVIAARRNVNTPKLNKGLYPCRVNNCGVQLPVGRLLNHIRSVHPDELTETMVDFTDSYINTWSVTVEHKRYFRKSFVFFVSGIGLLFINIEVLRFAYMIATIQIAMKFLEAQKYLACLEFFSNSRTFSYNTKLLSVRPNTKHLMLNKRCFTLNKKEFKEICVDGKFNCRMRLSRFNELDTRLLTTPKANNLNFVTGIRSSILSEEENKENTKNLTQVSSNKTNNVVFINGISNVTNAQSSRSESSVVPRIQRKQHGRRHRR